jgi:G3E family GTPase
LVFVSLPVAPLVQDRVRLDAILTVVDAKHILKHLDDTQIEEGAENEVSACHRKPLSRAAADLLLP